MRRLFLFTLTAVLSVLFIPLAKAQSFPQLRVLTYNIHHGEGYGWPI